MIQLSTAAKILYRNEIAPLLAQNRVEECTELLLETHTDTSKEVLAGLCEMGYAFVDFITIPTSALIESDITKAVIPEGVKYIGGTAFWDCQNLNSIKLPSSLRVIGGDAFRRCKSLNNVEIPEGVEKIGSWAFAGCKNLSSIQLPSSLRSIGVYAFDKCHNDIILYIPEDLHWEDVLMDSDEIKWYERHSKVR